MKLAVCIPCAQGHMVLLDSCLKYIENQTHKPDLIVISISSYNGNPISTNIPTTILYTDKQLYPGANRNRAAAEAVKQGATHLSFIDADDIMHPRRLECIVKAFREHPEITGFLHCFVVGPKHNNDVYKGLIEIPWEPITFDYMPSAFEPGEYGFDIIKFQYCYSKPRRGYGMAQNGHISVLADFWQENPYLETIGMGEDNHFSCSILKKNKVLAYTGDTLSLYMRGDFAKFQTGL